MARRCKSIRALHAQQRAIMASVTQEVSEQSIIKSAGYQIPERTGGRQGFRMSPDPMQGYAFNDPSNLPRIAGPITGCAGKLPKGTGSYRK